MSKERPRRHGSRRRHDESESGAPHEAPAGASPNDSESLSVQVAGGGGEPERLYVLSRPRASGVQVREFRFGSEELKPREYTATADELLAAFERARRERRRMSEDLYQIRLWLEGPR